MILPGVNPTSRPNTATIGIIGNLLDYLENRLFSTRVGVPTINFNTTITPGGKTKSFDLKSMYIACGTTASEVASLSTSCVVSVTGKDINGNEKSTETISFGPDQLYNSTMQLKEFVGWDKMASVGLRVLNLAPTTAAAVLFVDDFKYCPRY